MCQKYVARHVLIFWGGGGGGGNKNIICKYLDFRAFSNFCSITPPVPSKMGPLTSMKINFSKRV